MSAGWEPHNPPATLWICPFCDGPRQCERLAGTAKIRCGSCKTEFGEAHWLKEEPVMIAPNSPGAGELDAAFVERMDRETCLVDADLTPPVRLLDADHGRLIALARRAAPSPTLDDAIAAVERSDEAVNAALRRYELSDEGLNANLMREMLLTALCAMKVTRP